MPVEAQSSMPFFAPSHPRALLSRACFFSGRYEESVYLFVPRGTLVDTDAVYGHAHGQRTGHAQRGRTQSQTLSANTNGHITDL